MKSVNKVILLGNIGKGVEPITTKSGEPMAKASLATTESWLSKAGAWEKETHWHNLVFFKKHAENALKNVKKGSKLYIEGTLKYNEYVDAEGIKRYGTNIIVSNLSILDDVEKPLYEEKTAPRQYAKASGKAVETVSEFDDDIPF